MNPDCERTRAVAAELALGIADGDQRSEALEHLASCASCRAELDQLAATADSMLLTAPSAEPPAGFETSVLGRLDPPAHTRGPRVADRRRLVRSLVLAAAAVVVLVVGVGIGRVWTGGEGSTVEERVARGSLTVASGASVGEVTAVSGEPSLLVLTVAGSEAAPLPAGEYRVECVYGNGRAYDAGVMRIDPTQSVSAWSRTLDFRIDDLTQVRLLGSDGTDAVADIER